MQSAPGISRRLFRDCRIRFAHAPNDWLTESPDVMSQSRPRLDSALLPLIRSSRVAATDLAWCLSCHVTCLLKWAFDVHLIWPPPCFALPCCMCRQCGRGKWVISCVAADKCFFASCPSLPCSALPRSHFLFNLPVNASRWIHFMYSQFTIYNYYLPENKSPLFAGVFTVQMFGINTFCTLKYAQ